MATASSVNATHLARLSGERKSGRPVWSAADARPAVTGPAPV